MTAKRRLVYEEVLTCNGPLCLAGDDLAELKDLLADAQEGLALREALTAARVNRAATIADIGTHAAHMTIEQFRAWFRRTYSTDQSDQTEQPTPHPPIRPRQIIPRRPR